MEQNINQSKVATKPINLKISTIKLSSTTKDRLDHLQLYPRETYEEILIRILDVLNTARQTPDKARAKLLALDRQRRMNFKDVK